MAYGGFYVQREFWVRWPKALVMKHKTGNGEETRIYVPGRKCRNERHDGMFRCSRCGCGIYATAGDDCGVSLLIDSEYDKANPKSNFHRADEVRYCPWCGAKVVG